MISKRSRRRTSRKRSGGGDKKCIETPCTIEMPERTIHSSRNVRMVKGRKMMDPPSIITYPSYTIYKQSTKGLGTSSTYWMQHENNNSRIAEAKGKKAFMEALKKECGNCYDGIMTSSDAKLGKTFKSLKKVKK